MYKVYEWNSEAGFEPAFCEPQHTQEDGAKAKALERSKWMSDAIVAVIKEDEEQPLFMFFNGQEYKGATVPQSIGNAKFLRKQAEAGIRLSLAVGAWYQLDENASMDESISVCDALSRAYENYIIEITEKFHEEAKNG